MSGLASFSHDSAVSIRALTPLMFQVAMRIAVSRAPGIGGAAVLWFYARALAKAPDFGEA
jgi:hypothetical protein